MSLCLAQVNFVCVPIQDEYTKPIEESEPQKRRQFVRERVGRLATLINEQHEKLNALLTQISQFGIEKIVEECNKASEEYLQLRKSSPNSPECKELDRKYSQLDAKVMEYSKLQKSQRELFGQLMSWEAAKDKFYDEVRYQP